MKTLALLVIHVLTMVAQRVEAGGVKAIIAESVLLKHQQQIARRSVGKILRLTTSDRFLCGFLVLFMHPGRIQKVAVVLKPATLTKFRRVLLSCNYHRLFSPRKRRKPDPKSPSDDLIRVIVELKRRNTRFGCSRIAQQINKAFDVNIDKDVVRRVLAKHYRPKPYSGGPSWLTFFRHTSDSFRSINLVRRKSIPPNIHLILAAIGQFIRRIVSCDISVFHFNQTVFCFLFGHAIPVIEASKSLSPSHDPPSCHHRCREKLLGIRRIQTAPISPRAPPFVERRIGTRRRNHHNYRSNCGAVDLAREHEALDNNLFLIHGPPDENRSLKTNREIALSNAESQIFARKRYVREELRTLIAT